MKLLLNTYNTTINLFLSDLENISEYTKKWISMVICIKTIISPKRIFKIKKYEITKRLF